MLEEAQENYKKVTDLIRRAFKRLSEGQINIKRIDWLQEAIQAEKAYSLKCCEAIVKNVIQYGLDLAEQDQE